VVATAVRLLAFARRKHADLERMLARRSPAPALETEDIQGLVFRGYGNLRACQYVFLNASDPARARGWLKELIDQVSPGGSASRAAALHVAFTYPGLVALGLGDGVLEGFSQPFSAGMVSAHRRRLLGDVGVSAPEKWVWGGPETAPVHALLVLYGTDTTALSTLYAAQRARFGAAGWSEVYSLVAETPLGREHFGFADGISQPAIAGFHRTESRYHAIDAGEFVLGYRNEYRAYTERPLIAPTAPRAQVLPEDVEGSGNRDFGRNGTYLVVRQLRQDVPAFRSTLDALTRNADGSSDVHRQARLAAQMVGRWPSGASLIKSPWRDEPELAKQNEFGYHAEDVRGLRCPLGAHVRRANPRDALQPDPGTEAALVVNRRHRLLRRGRAYGPELPAGAVDTVDRGLMFVALNANLARQFEFVQHSWLGDPHFNGLGGESDPISGILDENGFTVQNSPVRERYTGLPRFVTVTGGAYFFLPGIRALRYLANLGEAL
jgi:Dyp-type peroxidase family